MEAPRLERITRSLAFMLRHQPEKFDLEVDRYGWAANEDVVRALNERLGEPVEEEDLRAAVESGDRRRYEIDGDRIRALYGHSIPVEPGESNKPPEVLYVGIDSRDAERARKYGLRGGRRRFLHLALSEEDAIDAGRRTAREYTIITIHALEAWEDGVDFYDRGSLFLAEEIPTDLIEVGETYDDGIDRRRTTGGPGGGRGRGGRGSGDGRRGGRGPGRSRSDERGPREDDSRSERSEREYAGGRSERPRSDRDDRPRGGRDDRPQGGRDDRPRSDRDDRPRGGRDDRPRGGRDDRPRGGRDDRSRGERDDRPRDTPREPDRGRPQRAPIEEVRPERVATAERPQAPESRPAANEPASSFGAGLFEPKAPVERPRSAPPKPAPAREPEPAPAPAPEPAAAEEDTPNGGSSFGAGL